MDIRKGIFIYRETSMKNSTLFLWAWTQVLKVDPHFFQCITSQSLPFLKNFLGMRDKYFFCIFIFFMFHPQLNRNKKEKQNLLSEESIHENINPTLLLPGNGATKELDNPQVQGIIVAIPNGGSDKYGV